MHVIPGTCRRPLARSARSGGLAALVLAVLLVVTAAPAAAAQIPATSAEGFPNGRTSNDLPSNAIDGNTATFTWTTETNNATSPSYLAIGFASSPVNRLRILKTAESGGGTGTGVKNLVIQYTNGTGPLVSRYWANVPNLRNGFGGAELLTAGAVNADGTISLDSHNGGFASLTFDQVEATGLRIGFSNITATGSCSVNPNGPCNHYRVAEFQAHLDGLASQPPIVGPPLFRILRINGRGELRSAADASDREPQVGWVLGEGDRVTAQGGLNIGSGSLVRLQKISDGSIVEVEGNVLIEPEGNSAHPAIIEIVDPTRFTGPAAGTDLILHGGRVTLRSGGASTQGRLHQAGLAGLLTPVARIAAGGGVATVVHDPKRGRTTAANVRGSVQVTPTNPALRGLQLVPGKQVEVTKNTITRPFALVPDLATTIPSPRTLRAGPALVTAPSKLSLRSLKRSKCVGVLVTSSRPARVLVTIFSGRLSVRLFGQRLVVFTAAGRRTTCIKVPARAKTFNVRTPLRFAVGYALGARARAGQRATQPVIRPIKLVP
jgi:hypothetical protein